MSKQSALSGYKPTTSPRFRDGVDDFAKGKDAQPPAQEAPQRTITKGTQPKGGMKRMTLDVPAILHKALKRHAAMNDEKLRELVVRLLESGLLEEK